MSSVLQTSLPDTGLCP